MCNRKCFRMPTLVIFGVILTIVLVCITGITLTNSINISNIIKLREKVASDSAAQSGVNAAQTRAALVEQQYSTLQQHHLTRSDLNYIAATHPKNLQRFNNNNNNNNNNNALNTGQQQNKIIIEIGIRNFTDAAAMSSTQNEQQQQQQTHEQKQQLPPITSAIVDGNIDSISVPADVILSQTRRQQQTQLPKNDTWMPLTTTPTTEPTKAAQNISIETITITTETNDESLTKVPVTVPVGALHTTAGRASVFEEEATAAAASLNATLPPSQSISSTTTTITSSSTTTTTATSAAPRHLLTVNVNDGDADATRLPNLSIEDHNPAMIDFEKRGHIQKVITLENNHFMG